MVKVFTLAFLVISFVVIGNAFKIEPRIVRGYTARAGQFPYYALLEIQSAVRNPHGVFFGPSTSTVMSRCGATLISDQWLVTAAHCLDGASRVNVHLGVTQTRAAEDHRPITVGRERFHFPSVYKKTPQWIDMALIHLPVRVEFSDYIKPVRMPATCGTPVNAVAFAMGYGITSDNGNSPSALQYAVLRTLPSDVCQRVFPHQQWSNLVTCAYDEMNYQSVCKGDSGGPLVTSTDGTLIGVSSFVRPDGCNTGAPQGFVNLIPYMNWIKKHTGLNLPTCG